MTTPEERTRAILNTREFLNTLIRWPNRSVSLEIRQTCRELLKNYPTFGDMQTYKTSLSNTEIKL